VDGNGTVVLGANFFHLEVFNLKLEIPLVMQ
jgi:hypothetical protein